MTAVVEDKAKSKSDLSLINQAINKHFIFTNLHEEDLEMVINSMQHYSIKSGDVVFYQGHPAKSYFILITGALEVLVDQKHVNQILPGSGFGELALLHDCNRSATIRATENSAL